MNIKEWLPILFLAVLTTWGIQYFFGNKHIPQDSHVQSGQQFEAPRSGIQVHKPLNLEIDFIDEKAQKKPVITTIETENAKYQFSTEAASLQLFQYKRIHGGSEQYLTTVFPPNVFEKEQRCFLVAFNENTPFNFNLVKKEENNESHILTYEALFDGKNIQKEFTIYKDTFQLDLKVSIESKNGTVDTVTPRIFFASPLLSALGKKDEIAGVVNQGKDSVVTKPKSEALLESYWAKPTLFGSEDKYFVHAMVEDINGFVQRAYYKAFDEKDLYSILEGPAISNSQTWKLSFYLGPKIDDDMAVVAPQLTKIIHYGLFGPVSKWLATLLLDILNWLNGFVNNYGMAIILLTILLHLISAPFTFKTEKTARQQREMNKKMKYLKEKYKNDPQGFQQAQAKLVKEQGLSMLGGCLPLLLQLPIIFALRNVLVTAIELYQAPFFWISDLSSPDPYYILPIVMGISIILQGLMGDAQQKGMMVGLGIFLAAILSNFAAGLILYIAFSSLLKVLQTELTKRVSRA